MVAVHITLSLTPLVGNEFQYYDFAAKTHRRDAGRAENFKHMRGDA
jgi:hypothetical protein